MPTEPVTQKHRHKDNPNPGTFSAMVARPVGRKEIQENEDAQKALQKELVRLRNKIVWGESCGKERSQVASKARAAGEDVHFARLHGLVT